MAQILLFTALAGIGGTGLGGLIGCITGGVSKKTVGLLLSFAAGVMVGVVCFDLAPEAMGQGFLVLALLGLGAGFSLVWLMEEQAAALKARAALQPMALAGLVMALAIALHNLPEGMVIGASGLGSRGLRTALVIGLHNIPEGMAVSVPLILGGTSRGRALVLTALAGAPTVLGALIGRWMGTMGPVGQTMSLSFAGGAMLYVVLAELLPEGYRQASDRGSAFSAMAGILTGVGMVLL